MKKITKFGFSILPILCLASCGTVDPSQEESASSSESTPVDKGELIIEDMPWVFYGNEPVNIPFRFTNPRFAKPITYTYNQTVLTIENNAVKLNASYNGNLTVTAETEDFETSFIVGCHKLPCDNSAASDVDVRLLDKKNRNVGPGWTVAIGDSFFDYQRFWKHFYEEMNGNVFCEGISSSTLETWIGYTDKLIIDLEPKNLIVHLGSNDLWDLQREPDVVKETFKYFVKQIHDALPNTHIYWMSVENRASKMAHDRTPDGSMTIQYINEFNEFLSGFCAERDYMTFVNVFSHFHFDDGSIRPQLFKEGVHPKDREYHAFIDPIIEAGCTDFTWKDIWSDVPDPSTLKDTDDHVYIGGYYSENIWVPATEKGLYKKEYSVKGTIRYDYSNAAYGNPHISFCFNGNDCDNRFLVWGESRGDMKVCASIAGAYYNYNPSSYFLKKYSGEFTYQFLVTTKSAYLFIDGELRCAALNCSLGSCILSPELVDCTYTGQTFDTVESGGHYASGLANEQVQELEKISTVNYYWKS